MFPSFRISRNWSRKIPVTQSSARLTRSVKKSLWPGCETGSPKQGATTANCSKRPSWSPIRACRWSRTKRETTWRTLRRFSARTAGKILQIVLYRSVFTYFWSGITSWSRWTTTGRTSWWVTWRSWKGEVHLHHLRPPTGDGGSEKYHVSCNLFNLMILWSGKNHQLLIGICVTDCMFMPGIRLVGGVILNTSFCITRANKVEYFTNILTDTNEDSKVNSWYIWALP